MNLYVVNFIGCTSWLQTNATLEQTQDGLLEDKHTDPSKHRNEYTVQIKCWNTAKQTRKYNKTWTSYRVWAQLNTKQSSVLQTLNGLVINVRRYKAEKQSIPKLKVDYTASDLVAHI